MTTAAFPSPFPRRGTKKFVERYAHSSKLILVFVSPVLYRTGRKASDSGRGL